MSLSFLAAATLAASAPLSGPAPSVAVPVFVNETVRMGNCEWIMSRIPEKRIAAGVDVCWWFESMRLRRWQH